MIPVAPSQADMLARKLKGLQNTIEQKTYKTPNEDILKFGFVFAQKEYKQDDLFEEVFAQAIKEMK